MIKNSLTEEQFQGLVERLSKRKNELEGRITIETVKDSLRELGLSDLLLENDIDEVCKQMNRELKMRQWTNYFKFALILMILTAPLSAFGGYKLREVIVAKFPEFVGLTNDESLQSRELKLQVKDLQDKVKDLETDKDKLNERIEDLKTENKTLKNLGKPDTISQATRTSVITESKPTPVSSQSVELSGIIYELKSCQKSYNVNSSTQSIICAILITSTKENVKLHLYSNHREGRSRLLDQGKEYVATKVELGTYSNNRYGYVNNSLIKDIPIEAIITFKGVSLDVKQIDVLQFINHLKSSYYTGFINTELRNVSVTPEK
ncbi:MULTISPECIES: hypothetical protein [Moorena]|uniref:Uncharacterized protein n=1 Tax=Moorena bouillonii PNG TaxID=568701 RepID=A0A1U7N1U1_9CYAN|nr:MULTISPECIES: hypothetical protein [Moorena]NEO25062.1 hypothetical protein [Moorena sp. SIO4A5]OLT59918.1 hypothetical protein BJP37_13705 [Moorena bouillonii PNG]